MRITIPRMAMALVALASMAVMPLAAQTFPASNDGWTTPGGGQTVVDLSGFPIARALGSAPVSNSVSMKGKALDSANLGSIDTLLERGAVTLSGGTGTGNLQLVALSLTSESNVRLVDGRSYRLDIVRSPTLGAVGAITITQTNSDGGTFNSGFDILPKLTFTNVNSPFDVVNIDCASGGCTPLHMSSSNTGWAQPGGSGGFNPNTKGITPIHSGITVQGYTTIGRPTSGALYPGYSPSGPTFPPAAVNEQQLLNSHLGNPVEDCKTGTAGALKAKAIAIQKLCAVVATPN